MTITWAEFRFPPINLWNVPRQPGLERQWLRRFDMRSDNVARKDSPECTTFGYQTALEYGSGKYPVALRRASWNPGTIVRIDEGQMWMHAPGSCEKYEPSEGDKAATDWTIAYGYM